MKPALLDRFPTLDWDPEEYEESLGYVGALNDETPASLSYAIEGHEIYRVTGPEQTVDRRAIASLPSAFEPLLGDSETHWQTRTSGTSGAPLELTYGSRFYFFNIFETLPRVSRWAGRTLATNHLHVYLTDNPAHAFRLHVDPRPNGASFVTVPIRAGVAAEWTRVLELLEQLRPNSISSKPNLFRMWLEKVDRPRFPDLRLLLSSGSSLSDELRGRLETAFDVPVANAYITSEAGHLGTACAEGKMHLDNPHARFEVLQAAGEVRAHGRGDLLVTNYLNDCMPLRRYVVGDQVDLRADGCPCGRPGPYLTEFSGRTVPLFSLPSGKSFSPTRWMAIYGKFQNLREFQITQRADRSLLVRVETVRGDLDFVEELGAFLQAGLEEKLTLDIQPATFPPDAKLQRFRTEAP